MAQYYLTVADYLATARNQLQDQVAPFRYTDDQVVDALNHAIIEMGRVRPDIFLDLKYQQPVRKKDYDEGLPAPFSSADVTQFVPIPAKYVTPAQWYISGWLQLLDIADAQDQRAQAFIVKFQSALLNLNVS